jgi:protein-S-isoprenylcysteine O-methyltransferase Ste14
MVVAFAVYGNGRQEHASILYYVISTLVVLACLAGSVLAFLAATKVAATSVRRRPRWLYALFALGYAVPVALFVRAALQHARAHTMNEGGWVPMAGGMVATYCVFAGLFMLGRALAWGRARRGFWIFPPMWLDHELMDRQERGSGSLRP